MVFAHTIFNALHVRNLVKLDVYSVMTGNEVIGWQQL